MNVESRRSYRVLILRKRFKTLEEGGMEGVISDIIYKNKLPWPKSPNGNGPSLLFISADQSAAANWKPSAEPKGSPGT